MLDSSTFATFAPKRIPLQLSVVLVADIVSNAGALAMFASGGVVLYAVAVPCAVANILGNQIGTRLAIRVGAKAVRAFLFITLTLLLVTLIYRFFLA